MRKKKVDKPMPHDEFVKLINEQISNFQEQPKQEEKEEKTDDNQES